MSCSGKKKIEEKRQPDKQKTNKKQLI